MPHADWQLGPTQASFMSADPWPLPDLLHTVSTPNKRQEPGWVNPPALVWSPDQEEHLRATWQGDAIRATDVPDLHAGPITHACPAATLAVAQRGQQNPQWVVCMFSPADAHIVVCDPERLPGPEAVVRVADCTRMIVKALREGEHHALLLQVRLKDNARAARPGMWPAAPHPAGFGAPAGGPDHSVPLATSLPRPAIEGANPTAKSAPRTGKRGCKQTRSAMPSGVSGPRPRHEPSMRRPRAARWPTHGSTGQPALRTSNEGRHPEVSALHPARGATEPTKCPLCADKYYTSGAMLEHLAWHAVHAPAPVDDKQAASNILQGRARRSPWHASYAWRPPPQVADHADGDEEAPGAAPGTGGPTQQGSIPARLAPLAPLWAPLETGSHPMAPAHLYALAAPADPAAMPMRDS